MLSGKADSADGSGWQLRLGSIIFLHPFVGSSVGPSEKETKRERGSERAREREKERERERDPYVGNPSLSNAKNGHLQFSLLDLICRN